MTDRTILALLTALAVALRLPALDAGLWFDEIVMVVLSVREPFLTIVTEYPWNNVHPLYSVFAHASIVALGEHAWTLRLPAVIFGAASVPFTYLLAVEMGYRRQALWSAALVAVSQHHIWFSQSARGYTMLGFFALVCTWLVLRGRRAPRTGTFLAYGAAAALGAYTHLTMGFIVAAHALVVAARILLSRDRLQSRAWRGFFIAFGSAAVLTVALYAPLLADTTAFFTSPQAASGARVATTSWAALELLRQLDVGLGTVGLAIGGVLALAGGWRCLREDWEAALLMTLPAVVTLAGTVGLGRPIFPRFFFFMLAFAMIFLARGASAAADAIARRWPGAGSDVAARVHAGVLLLVVLLSAATVGAAYGPKQDYAGALAYVERERTPADVVVTAGLASEAYGEYFHAPWLAVETAAALREVRAASGRTWVVYTFPRYLDAMHPDLADVIRRECATVQTFRGTVNGGDVTVCVLQPAVR